MNKPKKPRKPTKPKEPEQFYTHKATLIHFESYQPYALTDLLDLCKEKQIDIKDVTLEHTDSWDDYTEAGAYYEEKLEDSFYEDKLSKYQTKLKEYQTKLKKI